MGCTYLDDYEGIQRGLEDGIEAGGVEVHGGILMISTRIAASLRSSGVAAATTGAPKTHACREQIRSERP